MLLKIAQAGFGCSVVDGLIFKYGSKPGLVILLHINFVE